MKFMFEAAFANNGVPYVSCPVRFWSLGGGLCSLRLFSVRLCVNLHGSVRCKCWASPSMWI